ncbi:MAG: HNH endonuclease signature motif containing protein [Candidatus Gracilibacteria bacterium]|nr:HNH endonuclease signature motif containing protein [Candidatus Gracilibacteria bacterium]
MRIIKTTQAYSKIFSIRKYVFEEILSQIIKRDGIDFSINKYLQRIEKLRTNKEHFITLISNISQKDAKKSLKISLLQDEEIRKSIFNVSKKEISDEIINLLEFIYEKIIFSESYWSGLDEGIFSKMIFKKIFFEDQEHCICPYCDSKEDFELLDFEIDHLLPKSEFPLLYINEMNLFPCCSSCNHNYHGKGNNWNEKYYNLFQNTLGLMVDFEFEPEFRIIGIDDISTDFFKLIQLEKRCKKDLFTKKIDILRKKIFRDLKIQENNRTFLDIQAPHYFLVSAIYKYYENNKGSFKMEFTTTYSILKD